MESANAWLAILSAVVGLVGFYLRYYTQATVAAAVEKITQRIDERLGAVTDRVDERMDRLREDLHTVDAKLSRLEGRVQERREHER